MKLILWTKIVDGKFEFSAWNKARLLDFIKDCLEFKLTIEKKSKPKSEQALGMYFANILPSIIAHDKGLVHKGQILNNPLAVKDLISQRRISWQEVQSKHRDIMVTFRPDMATNILTGETYRIGQELKDKNNTELVALITEILEALEPQGYEFGDAEEYKALRDGVYLPKGDITYPQNDGEQPIF